MRAPKRLPFLMSGHVCHLIVFSPHMPLTLLLSFLPSHQLCVSLTFFLFRCHITEHNWGSADWMIEPMRAEGVGGVGGRLLMLQIPRETPGEQDWGV